MALGASGTEVVRWIVRTHLALVVRGLGLGLLAAVAVGRWLEGLLHGVPPTDPATWVAVSLFLVLVTSVAAWLPARRAARVEPMTTLRDG